MLKSTSSKDNFLDFSNLEKSYGVNLEQLHDFIGFIPFPIGEIQASLLPANVGYSRLAIVFLGSLWQANYRLSGRECGRVRHLHQ